MGNRRNARKLYVSREARARLLSRYEGLLRRWREATGLELERIGLRTRAGGTTVFAFGPATRASGTSGAPPLILLHGTLSNSSMWLGDAAILAASRRVFAVDIPGEPGLSEERCLDWQGGESAAWLGEVVKGLGLGEHDLCGFSIGGWIALAYAIGRPRDLRSLALLCPSGIGRTKRSFILKAMLQMPRGRPGYESIARSLYGDLEPPAGAIEAGAELSMATNPRIESPRIFTDAELSGIEARLFLAVGEKDLMLHSRESAARLATLRPEAEIQILPGAGHALVGQGERIVRFLDSSG